MSGKTDARIITDLLTAVGMSAAEIGEKLPAVYELMADKAREIYPDRGIVPCLGIEDLLAYLRSREDVLLGLLTGNSLSTTPLKLQAADIDPEQFLSRGIWFRPFGSQSPSGHCDAAGF